MAKRKLTAYRGRKSELVAPRTGALRPGWLGFAAAFAVTSAAQAAGPTTQFTVSGNVAAPRTFTLGALQALPAITLNNVTYLSGTTPVTGSFTGPSLWYLLNTAVGLRTDATIKNDILRNVVIATGSDGYQAVLSGGELNPDFGGSANRPDLVAYANNGQTLTTDAVARTVVPGDSRGGRYVSNLTSLQVVHAPAQTGTFSGGITSQFTVTGQVTAPRTYTLTSLQTLPPSSVTVSGSTYTGVNLWTLLDTVGIVTNPTIKNNILSDYVVATGSDGYQAVIALGEISPLFGNQPDLVATSVNGGSLGANGFARLVVPNDVKQGRWVSNLVNLEVFDVTQWVANAGERTDLTGLAINAQGFHLNGGALVSSTGAATLTVPTARLDGGSIAAGVTVASPNTIVQASGLSILSGTLSAPLVSVNAGSLVLNGGRVAGAVGVASGATLAGTGQVTGALTFAAGSQFAVAVSPTATDTVAVGGAANLAGTAQVTVTQSNAYRPGTRYALLTANGGVNGTFGTLALNGAFPNWVNPTLVYGGNEVDLLLAAKTLSSQISAPLTGNQRAVAGGIDALLLTNGAQQAFLDLFNQPASSLPRTLSTLTGEAVTSAQTASLRAGASFLNLLLDPNTRVQASGTIATAPALAYADEPQLPAGGRAIRNVVAPTPLLTRSAWNVWASAFGGFGSLTGQGTAGSARVTNDFAGIAAGADYRASADFVAGFGIAGGGTSYRLGSGLGAGSSSLFQAGVFASKTFGGTYVSAAGSYTWTPSDVHRLATTGATIESLRAKPLGQTIGGRIETGTRLAFGLTPYAAFEAQNYATNTTTERSSLATPAFALTYAGQSVTSLRSELGLRAETAVDLNATMQLVGFGRLAWAHEFRPDRSATATFASLPVASFVVRGASAVSDAALVTAGAELRLDQGLTMFAKADADLAPRSYELRGNVGLRYAW